MKKFIFFILILILSTSSVYSIQLFNPIVKDYVYDSGKVINITFGIRNQMWPMGARVVAEGDFENNTELNETYFPLLQTGEIKSILAIITLPKEKPKAGIHSLYLGAVEERKNSGTIQIQGKVLTKINFRVRHDGKYAEGLFKSKYNVDGTVNINAQINNFGEEKINNVVVYYNIKDGNNNTLQFGELKTNDIEKDKSKIIGEELNIEKYPKGKYIIEGYFVYDSLKNNLTPSKFQKGELNIKIVNNSKIIYYNKINEISVDTKSGWNNEIKNIYYVFKIGNSTRKLKEIKSPNYNLKPFEEKNIKTYIDVSGLEKGEYNGEIELNYENKKTIEKFKIDIVDEPEIRKPFNFIKDKGSILILISLLIVVAINLILLYRIYIKKK